MTNCFIGLGSPSDHCENGTPLADPGAISRLLDAVAAGSDVGVGDTWD